MFCYIFFKMNSFSLKYFVCFFSLSVAAFIDLDVSVKLDSAGFHRSLVTNITLYGNISTCGFLVKHKLNEHIYVNTNELDEMKRNGLLLTRLDKKIEIEGVASSSKPFSVWIYQKEPLLNSNDEYHSTILFTLPIHIRYHNPQKEGGFTQFNISYPSLFINCSLPSQGYPGGKSYTLPCSAFSTNFCDWMTVPIKQKNPISVLVPVGNKDHEQIVQIATHTVTVACALVILYTLFFSSER